MSVSAALDYRKNPAGVLDKLKISGVNVDGSTRKLKECVSDTSNKRKIELQKKKPEAPFKEIEFGKNLKEIPKCFLPLVLSFVGYLAATSTFNFKIEGRKLSTGELTTNLKPYIHRWTPTYRKSIIAKLFQLERNIGEEQNNVTMISLTVNQRGMDPITCLLNLMRAYRSLMDVMRKKYGKTDYFWILEPHKTGYAHMHLLYWRILSEGEKEHIHKLWERKYQAGGKGVAIHFSLPKASEDGTFKAGSIAKVRSYLIKYLLKGLHKEWSPGELLFNAVLWRTKTRLWGCSRNFSKLMKPEIHEREDWECSKVWLCDTSEDEEPDLVWSKERKESGFLGSVKNSKSLVDCEKETSHHSVNAKHRSKEYDDKLLRDVCKPESEFYNHIRLQVTKNWAFIQSVPSLTDSMKKKISSGVLRAEEHTIESIHKSGVSSFISQYWLYEPIIETSFTPSPTSYSPHTSSPVEICSCRTTHAKRFAREKKKHLSSKGQSYL